MAPTITVDGDEIIDASIDGDAVEEITIDGDLAWAAAVGLDGLTVTRQDGSYTASSGEHVVSNGGTITLPSPVQDGVVMVTEVQTSPQLTGTVDGITDPYISGDESVVFVSDGSAWYSVDRNQISAIPDSVVSRDPDTNSASNEEFGIILSTNVGWSEIQARISSNSSNFSTASILKLDSSNNVLSTIASVDISSLSAGDVVTFSDSDLSENLTETNDYAFVLDDSATAGYDNGPSFPYTSSDGNLELVTGWRDNNSDNTQDDAFAFDEIGNINL